MAPCTPALFDGVPRSDPKYRYRGEPWFVALNRRVGPEADRIRSLCETWFSRLPVPARAKLRGHFRSRDDRKFCGAFWELYLHESFVRLGYSVEVEPHLHHTSRRPDFRLTRGAERVYVEALTVNDDDGVRGETSRAVDVERALDAIDDPRFVGVPTVRRIGHAMPSAGALRRVVEGWLLSLPEMPEGQTAAETFAMEDWSVRLLVFRRPQNLQGRGFVVGAFAGLWRGQHHAAVRDCISAKHRAYGHLDAPLTLAVMTTGVRFTEFTAQEALLGRVPVHDPGAKSAVDRGYWSGADPAAVDTVIFASSEVAPSTVPRVCPRVWTRGAVLPQALATGPWPIVRVCGPRLEGVPASLPLGPFFDLPPSWPRLE